ncbi:MAG: sigma-70 family RNA polymerase sigma factor [Cyclobacteriaceae bacterium]
MYYSGKALSHDSQEFRVLFDNYFPTLCLFAGKIINDKDAAKDVVQEVFIKLLGSDAMFENEKAIKAYLYVLTRNSCLDRIKKLKNGLMPIDIDSHDYSEESFLKDVVREETFRLLDIAIKELGAQSQQVVKLTMNQLSNKEIAEDLDISINTVKTLKLRSYNKIRKKLGGHFALILLSQLIFF